MITVRNLTCTFHSPTGGDLLVLDSINLEVRAGEMVALIGACDSGKSTLLRHISGLTAGGKKAGEIYVMGRAVQSHGRIRRETRANIGVIFQQSSLVNRLSVYTNVLLGALGRFPLWRACAGLLTGEDKRLAFMALARVGIVEKSFQRASTLSGGQLRRAAIARALMQKVRVLLADDPVASLDPESSRRVMDVLSDLNRKDGLTVLVSLNRVEYARAYCPRTVVLEKGRVVYDGPSGDLTPAFLRELDGAPATGESAGNGSPSVRKASRPQRKAAFPGAGLFSACGAE
jgi:phosphonate transport system ATP-binding protein